MKISGQGFVVTGGLGGVGGGCALGLVKDGGKVIIWDILPESQGVKIAQDAGAFGYLEVDVGNAESVKRAVASSVDLLKKDNTLLVGAIHCAAIVKRREWTSRMGESVHDFESVLKVNAFGTFAVDAFISDAIQDQYEEFNCQHPVRVTQEKGVIINIASVAAKSYARTLTYGPTKTATIGITESAADYLGPVGIRVNSVSPSIVDTPMMKGKMGFYVGLLDAGAAFPRRPVTLEELYQSCKFLIENEMMNGFDLRVDGLWKLVSDWHGSSDPRKEAPVLE